jgi:hypothetical protein
VRTIVNVNCPSINTSCITSADVLGTALRPQWKKTCSLGMHIDLGFSVYRASFGSDQCILGIDAVTVGQDDLGKMCSANFHFYRCLQSAGSASTIAVGMFCF